MGDRRCLFVYALGRIGVGLAIDRVGSRTRVLRWVAVSGVVVMLALVGCGAVRWAAASAVVLVAASTVSVADNGPSFTSVAEAGDSPEHPDPTAEGLSLIAMSAGLGTSVITGYLIPAQAQEVIDYHLNRLFPDPAACPDP